MNMLKICAARDAYQDWSCRSRHIFSSWSRWIYWVFWAGERMHSRIRGPRHSRTKFVLGRDLDPESRSIFTGAGAGSKPHGYSIRIWSRGRNWLISPKPEFKSKRSKIFWLCTIVNAIWIKHIFARHMFPPVIWVSNQEHRRYLSQLPACLQCLTILADCRLFNKLTIVGNETETNCLHWFTYKLRILYRVKSAVVMWPCQ